MTATQVAPPVLDLHASIARSPQFASEPPIVVEARQCVQKIATFIHAHTDVRRTDRIWPASEVVFATNPLSLAFGALGIALFLRRATGEVPAEVMTWLADQPVHPDDYPPGLNVGSAGIGLALWELGLHEKAEEVMGACFASTLRFEDPTLAEGAAGWGRAALAFHRVTGRDSYADRAQEAADYLRRSAITESTGVSWRASIDNRVHYGYGYGAAGIASFLVEAGTALHAAPFQHLALQAIQFELSSRNELRTGWAWSRFRGDSMNFPYFMHGSSGIGTVLARNVQRADWNEHQRDCERIAEDSYCVWSVLPSLFDGHAGVGEFALDMFHLTGRGVYFERALRIARSVMLYAAERDGGCAFPGRWLNRLSLDIATGSAGVGVFLHRLYAGGPRMLVDLDLQVYGKPLAAAAIGGAH